MNITENILKHNLQNVYFLTGTALAGKTTMTKVLANKYNFVPFHDNHNEPHFKIWEKIRTQKCHSKTEYIEYVVIELIKLAKDNKVVADVCIPLELLNSISEYNRIACMLALPELVTCENYGNRDDHKDWWEWILSHENSKEKIAQENELFRIQTEQLFNEVEKSKLFNIVRTKDSTIENTLKMLEEHFGL